MTRVRWYFRDISDDPSEKELTQQDQFNNDEVALAEALVRETIQNSTDAQLSPQVPVQVRFLISDPAPVGNFVQEIINGLTPHLAACEIDVPPRTARARHLTIEDFGTTGLTGAIDAKDNGQFSGFWRRFGRSNKQGSKGGRWGLGKLVFPSASAVRVVLGLTRRADDDCAWLMGQAILRNHLIDGSEKDSVGFWCRADDARKGVPTNIPAICDAAIEAADFHRTTEPGLSLFIPCLLPDISKELLIEATIKNYYFPILTGRLSVTINDCLIDATTFDQVAAGLKRSVPKSVLEFVRLLEKQQQSEPALTIPDGWQAGEITTELLGEQTVKNLRDRYKNGELLAIRAPILATQKDGTSCKTYVDLYLKSAPPGEIAQTLVIRGSITVPSEGKRSTFTDCHAALVAKEPMISRLLGDAENPAHTQWNERAEKLRSGWKSGYLVLRRIRALLPDIYHLITERIERDDPFALLEFFSIPRPSDGGRNPNVTVGKPQIPPASQLKTFRIERRAGGFAVLPGPGADKASYPLRLRVTCAYDVLTGNPYKRFSEYDFNFFLSTSFRMEKVNVNHWPVEPNVIDVEAQKPDFKFEVLGFDHNRDVIVDAEDIAIQQQA